MVTTASPDVPIIQGFKLLAHHELNGFGGLGEGTAIQIAPATDAGSCGSPTRARRRTSPPST